MLVDAVVAWMRTRIKGWPNRTGQRLRRRWLTEKAWSQASLASNGSWAFLD